MDITYIRLVMLHRTPLIIKLLRFSQYSRTGCHTDNVLSAPVGRKVQAPSAALIAIARLSSHTPQRCIMGLPVHGGPEVAVRAIAVHTTLP